MNEFLNTKYKEVSKILFQSIKELGIPFSEIVILSDNPFLDNSLLSSDSYKVFHDSSSLLSIAKGILLINPKLKVFILSSAKNIGGHRDFKSGSFIYINISEFDLIKSRRENKDFSQSLTPTVLFEFPFVARSFVDLPQHMKSLLKASINTNSFSMIEALYLFSENKSGFSFDKDIYDLRSLEGYKTSDRFQAISILEKENNKVPIGVIYRNPEAAPNLLTIEENINTKSLIESVDIIRTLDLYLA